MNREHRLSEKVSNIFAETKSGDALLYDFSWGTGEVTEGEKARAEAGAAARGTYGAKRDKCKKGKSCGAACIFYRKDCVLELPVTTRRAIGTVRNYLVGLMSGGGISEDEAFEVFQKATGLGRVPNQEASLRRGEITPQSQASLKASVRESRIEQRYAKARELIKQIKAESTSKEDYKERVTYVAALAMMQGQGNRPKSITRMTEKEQEALKNPENQKHFAELQQVFTKMKNGEYKTEAEFNAAVAKATEFYRTYKPTDAQTELFLTMVSTENRAGLGTKGVAAGNVAPYWGTDKPGRNATLQPTPASGTPEAPLVKKGNEWDIARTYLESRGLDIYSRLPVKFRDTDLEHTIPENVAGKWANTGSNRTLTSSYINQQKSNHDFDKSFSPQNGILTTRASAGGETMGRSALTRDLEARSKSASQVLAMAGSLPKALDSKDWKQLNSAVVSHVANVPQTVTIGRAGGSKNNTLSWYLFGGKEASGWDSKASVELGSKMANTLAKWEGQGAAGTQKIASLQRLINQVRTEVATVNNTVVGGQKIRDIGFKENPEARKVTQDHIEATMQKYLPQFNTLLEQ